MRTALILAASLVTLACGSDRWLDVPMSCKDLEAQEKVAEIFEQVIGPTMCRSAGALSYGGEYRCKGDNVQVLCEES